PPDSRRPTLLRPSPHARDRHPERERAARDRAADAPETEDAQSHVAELPHREAKVRELFPRPRFRGLRLAHPVEAAGEVGEVHHQPAGHSPDDTVRTPGWWSSATIT